MPIDALTAAQLAQLSYNETGIPTGLPTGWTAVAPSTQLPTGFTGNAFYNSTSNTLVIGYGGTNGGADIWTDAQLAVTGNANQVPDAVNYAATIMDLPEYALSGNNPQVVFVGHSLGGFLAQRAALEFPGNPTIVFNAPGLGGFGGSDLTSDDVIYYYSNPDSWDGPSGPGFAGALVTAGNVHNLGDLLNDNVLFVLGSEGHPLATMLTALAGGEIALTADQWGAILAEQVRNGDIELYELLELQQYGQEIWREVVMSAMRQSGTECFMAGTAITMADGSSKPIEKITPEDRVMSFDPETGALCPGRVTRTFQKEATIVLNYFGTFVTPGHVFLEETPDGEYAFAPLIDILRQDGALLEKDGRAIRAATGQPVGSAGDAFVEMVTGEPLPEGGFRVAARAKLRTGTRVILEDGRDVALSDLITAAGGMVLEDGLVATPAHPQGQPFHWAHGPLPAPEDYVLARSGTTLEAIYRAAEWEHLLPQMPAPPRRAGIALATANDPHGYDGPVEDRADLRPSDQTH